MQDISSYIIGIRKSFEKLRKGSLPYFGCRTDSEAYHCPYKPKTLYNIMHMKAGRRVVEQC
jgi:hypothetical protein